MAHPRILTVDVGTGTQDILIFEAGTVIENSVQLIMPSPTVLMAEQVGQATADRADLLLAGVTMGGGPFAWAIEAHLKAGLRVYATPDPARTFDDDLSRVEAMGIRVIEEGSERAHDGARRLELRDFSLDTVMLALRAFGVSTRLDAIAVAVFDHGAAPPGYSDRRFRFDYLSDQVGRGARLEAFGYLAAEIPARMTRMRAVIAGAGGVAGNINPPLFVMDTGPAAVLGALDDPRVRLAEHAMVVNLGNFHTLAFLLDRGRICGLFEHHTGELTQAKLERYLDQMMDGSIRNQAVFDDMGHGALELGAPGWAPDILAVTGPRRSMLEGSRLNPYFAVPHGDMMLAGCFGLLRALAHRLPEHRTSIEAVLGAAAI